MRTRCRTACASKPASVTHRSKSSLRCVRNRPRGLRERASGCHSCSPGHDETPHKDGHDGDVVDDIECGAGTDADGDRKNADQRPEQRETLSSQARGTRPRRPDPCQRCAGLAYFRLHGSPRKYWSPYPEEFLATLAASIGHVCAADEVWCVFDNTASGAAAANALELSERLRDEASSQDHVSVVLENADHGSTAPKDAKPAQRPTKIKVFDP
jgi:hypothetical protein